MTIRSAFLLAVATAFVIAVVAVGVLAIVGRLGGNSDSPFILTPNPLGGLSAAASGVVLGKQSPTPTPASITLVPGSLADQILRQARGLEPVPTLVPDSRAERIFNILQTLQAPSASAQLATATPVPATPRPPGQYFDTQGNIVTPPWIAPSTNTPSSMFGRFYQGRTLHVAVMEIKRAPEVRYATIDPEGVIRHYRLLPAEKDLELVLVRLKVENHTATSAIFTVDQQGAELRDFFRGTYQPLEVTEDVFQDMRGQSSATVHVKSGRCFDPKRLNITLGTAVNWVNDDEVEHFVRLGAVAGQSETTEPTSLKPGESFSFTFEEPGQWEYQCGDSELTEETAVILVEEESDKPTVDEQPIVFITGPFELQQDMGIDGWMVFEAPEGTKFRSIRWRAGDSIAIVF